MPSLPLITLIISILGISFIIFRKIPLLKAIPLKTIENQESFFSFLKRKLFEIPDLLALIYSWFISIFEKYLLRIKILSLKIHNKTHNILETVRSKKKGDIENVSSNIENQVSAKSDQEK